MNICSNTSPIIFLSKIGQLELLTKCFSAVYIPNAVKSELKDQEIPDFITTMAISEVGKAFVSGGVGTLHHGELESIVLARELKADFVLLDDNLARTKAKRMGIQVIGTLGVLILANKKQLISIDKTREFIDTLINTHSLFISTTIRTNIETALDKNNSNG